MLTTKELLERAARKFDLPYETVKVNYDAWVRGMRERILDEKPLTIWMTHGIKLFFQTKTPTAFYGQSRMEKRYEKSRKIKKELVKKIKDRLRPYNTNYKVDKYTIYCHEIPIMYYGIKQGYTLKELEETQQRLFDKYNKHDYEPYYKNKKYSMG